MKASPIIFISFFFLVFSVDAQIQPTHYSDTVSCNGGLFECVIDYDQQTCASTCNGSYSISVITGVGPYTYDIVGPSYTHNDFEDDLLCTGTYTATVTDAGQGGITCVQNFEILSLGPNNYTINSNDATTSNPCDGSIEIILSGGVPPYTYQWYDSDMQPIAGETDFFIDSICGGEYYVQFYDNTPPCAGGTGGCGSAGSGLILVEIFDPLVVTLTGQGEPNCPNDGSGWITYSISGGSGNYTCDPPGCENLVVGPGTYNIVVTDDAGNSDGFTTTIDVWPGISIYPTPTNETFSGSCDGSIFFEDASGWGSGGYSIDGGSSYEFSQNFENLCPGNYHAFTKVPNSTNSGYCDIDLGWFTVSPGSGSPNTGTDIQSTCDSYTWIDGNTYTSSNNTATHTLTNAAGCDSVVTLDLTITNSTSGTDIQSTCDSYTWIDGNTYTSSNNSATHTLTNAAGCDSVVTLDLTITNSTSGTDIQSACNSYTWIDGNTYTSSNNTATHTLTNTAGCDSVVTLDLTITNSTSGTDQQTACKSFTWIDGNTYTTTNNTATHTLTNAVGCDSVVTLDLTINSISDLSTSTSGVTITANNTGASYQWLDCDDGYAVIPGETGQSFTASANGNYAVELTENECLDTSACVSISNVGIIENSFGNAFTVYPNPTDGNFSIDLGSVYEKTQVSIIDASGRVVFSKAITQSQVIPLSIEESAGVYLVTILAGKNKALVRLIKE